MQNPPRDERTPLRRVADLEQRIRTLETASKPFTPVVSRFADAASRTAVIPTPAEGDLSYQADDDTYYVYSGSDWVALSSAAAMALAVAAGAAWQAFSPTWSGSVSNPSIGNGSILGRYNQVGKTVSFRIQITMGSTTTYGSGVWGLTLPAPPSDNQVASAGYIDSSATLRFAGSAWLTTGSGIFRLMPPADGGAAGVTGANPFAWATNDLLLVNGTYETA